MSAVEDGAGFVVDLVVDGEDGGVDCGAGFEVVG